jgi:hypothetical protein
MSKNISKNFITIQGWMVEELDLNSNNLLVFALIYGFNQDEESEFTGSLNYICNWLNCSRPTASKALNDLVEKQLLIKHTKHINNITFNSYKINFSVVKKLYGGSKETLSGGSKETLPYIDNINNNNYKRDEIFENSILSFWGFNEIANYDKARLVKDFVFSITNAGKLDYFKKQFADYQKVKTNPQFKHSLQKFLGQQSQRFEDGTWDSEIWETKIVKNQTQLPKGVIDHSDNKDLFA